MIQADNLTKRFGQFTAVDRVSFEVRQGEVLGFLGPNGAGKSTSMRMITGFIDPDEGQVTIGQYSMADDPIRAKSLIGYLPENAPLYGDMSVDGFLMFIASLRGLGGKARLAAIDRVIDVCELQPVRYQSIDTLSKGYRHRTCFAQAMVHDPQVLVLDEPTDGLDPNQKHQMRNLIKRMGETKAIILSTHILEEVDAVCSRVIIVSQGRLVFNGLPRELRGRSTLHGAVTVRVLGQNRETVANALATVPGVAALETLDVSGADTDAAVRLRLWPSDAAAATGLAARLAARLAAEGWALDELHTEEGRLDEVFRDITSAGRSVSPAANPPPAAPAADTTPDSSNSTSRAGDFQ